MPCTFHREDRKKVSIIEVDIDLAIGRRARDLRIGYIENLLVSASGKACCHRLAYPRVCPVASGDVCSLVKFLAPGCAQSRKDSVSFIGEAGQLHWTLDSRSRRLQS